MAGGRGTRLQMGEKGLVRLCDRPLIEYVLTALEEAGLEPIVVTTPKTPYTANFCRARGIEQICTEGAGYIEDVTEVVTIIGEEKPVLIVCADIPGIRVEHLTYILSLYESGSADACSVWVPARYISQRGGEVRYSQDIEGVRAVPAGLNIIHGSKIPAQQTEIPILIDDPALAFNINTPSELETAESFFLSQKSQPDPVPSGSRISGT
ncbi:MAG: 5-deoxyadenosylcobinamide phosphate nucleotidyltransferase [Methanomicrobiales archaeon HGW-Methanomicrobiales-4]|nr:MAG: 5-deoxyadenosylcobinamide phosphate nucleotidyltransferase [Methanomicrobiales archaeon HGW-Methanomicrobiales-4]